MTITDANFNEVLNSGKPVMVDFGASWCGPCKAIAPVVEALAEEYEGKIIIGKCDVDDNQDSAIQYRVRNVPTLLFFKDGVQVDKIVGAAPKDQIVAKLEALL